MALHTQGSIQEYFSIESHVLSTRSADAYNAIDKSRGSQICLWLLRHPLATNSEAVKRFLSRLKLISELKPPVCQVNGYGVDSSGTAFVVLNALDGHVVTEGTFENFEAERRFVSCLNLVKRFHEMGIACGDICSTSFWMSREGDIRFIGVMGSFDTEAAATAMLPPMDTLHFVAPEQRAGGGLEQASDVFALGVLGFYLFVRKYPFGDHPPILGGSDSSFTVPKPSALIMSPPVWLDEVLSRCLDFDPSRRYSSAGDILNAIGEIRHRISESQNVPVRQRKGEVEAFTSRKREVGPVRETSLTTVDPKGELHFYRRNRLKLMAIVALTVTCVVVITSYLISSGDTESSRLKQILEPNKYVTGKDLREAISGLSESGVSFAEKTSYLEKVARSDDPIMYDALIKIAVDAPSDSFRKLTEKVILDRARRHNLIRSVEVVRGWLDGLPLSTSLPTLYQPLLRALDTSLPMEAISGYLREAYAYDPVLTLRLSAALALDSSNISDYDGVLSQLVGDSMKLDEAGVHSGLSLILASPILSQAFSDDVIQRRQLIPDRDLLWLLDRLAEGTDSNIRAVASSAIDRGLVPPIKRVFLIAIRDRSDLPREVLQALVRAALGTLTSDDVGAFGRWYDVSVEKVLLTVCVIEKNPDVVLDAFDTVAARTLTSEPTASLVEWIRKEKWPQRQEFIRIAGMLANVELLEAEELQKEMVVFDKYSKDPALIQLLVDSGIPQIVKIVLARYQTQVGLGRLLNLLDNPDKEVRMNTINVIKSYNDIGVLKIVIDHFEKEKDADVRKAYIENFWFIKQRVTGQATQ